MEKCCTNQDGKKILIRIYQEDVFEEAWKKLSQTGFIPEGFFHTGALKYAKSYWAKVQAQLTEALSPYLGAQWIPLLSIGKNSYQEIIEGSILVKCLEWKQQANIIRLHGQIQNLIVPKKENQPALSLNWSASEPKARHFIKPFLAYVMGMLSLEAQAYLKNHPLEIRIFHTQKTKSRTLDLRQNLKEAGEISPLFAWFKELIGQMENPECWIHLPFEYLCEIWPLKKNWGKSFSNIMEFDLTQNDFNKYSPPPIVQLLIDHFKDFECQHPESISKRFEQLNPILKSSRNKK